MIKILLGLLTCAATVLIFYIPVAADNGLSRFLLCCLKCCFWCLERFLRYMNRNAYIMVSCMSWIAATHSQFCQQPSVIVILCLFRWQSMVRTSVPQPEKLSSYWREMLSGKKGFANQLLWFSPRTESGCFVVSEQGRSSGQTHRLSVVPEQSSDCRRSWWVRMILVDWLVFVGLV